MNLPSKLAEEAVQQIAKLPGIGKKSALRLVLHLLKRDERYTEELASALLQLRKEIRYCQQCHSISDTPVCHICANERRDAHTLCVVESITDVLAIENTGSFTGRYHVLGGLISPMEGIGPSDLTIGHLLERVEQEGVQEIIFALKASMEADTTTFYLSRKLSEMPVRISSIARGVPVGGELEYTDEVTLGRSIADRTTYKV